MLENRSSVLELLIVDYLLKGRCLISAKVLMLNVNVAGAVRAWDIVQRGRSGNATQCKEIDGL